jgi:peptide/nickel transport system substrate-binding protein
MRYKVLRLALVVVLALALLVPVWACGDKGGDTTGPKVEEGQYGGVLDYYLLAYPAGWDMQRKISMSPFVTIAVFNNLLRMDPMESVVNPENVRGDLAESWDVSADGLTWTFYLHEGVKWHDGAAFTADDVVYSMEKMKDKERSSVSTYFTTLDQVIKVDDHTVKMVLSKPTPDFLLSLAVGYCSIQPKHLAGVEYKSTDFLVGTGPFKFKSTVAGVSIELERNPDYFKEDEKGNQLPYLDGLNIHVISDRSAQMNAFLSGRLDMMTPGLGITNKDQYQVFTATQPEGAVLDPRNPPTGPCLWFSFDFEPFKDIRVRQAMNLLFDREQYAVAAYGDTEFSNLAATFFSPPFSIGKEKLDEIKNMDKTYEERIAMAQKLMADAGYADGFTIRFPQTPMTESLSSAE